MADWIGAGLDPEKQHVLSSSRSCPSTPSSHLLLSMVVPVPWLERVPTYKEQQETLKDKDLSSIGFLGYPLLQTADVDDVRRAVRAGRRRSGGASRARRVRSCGASTTSSASVLGRAAAAADDGSAACRASTATRR